MSSRSSKRASPELPSAEPTEFEPVYIDVKKHPSEYFEVIVAKNIKGEDEVVINPLVRNLNTTIQWPPFITKFPELTSHVFKGGNTTGKEREFCQIDISTSLMHPDAVHAIAFVDNLESMLVDCYFDNQQRLLGKRNQSVEQIRALLQPTFVERINKKTGSVYVKGATFKIYAKDSNEKAHVDVFNRDFVRILPTGVSQNDLVSVSTMLEGARAPYANNAFFRLAWHLIRVVRIGAQEEVNLASYITNSNGYSGVDLEAAVEAFPVFKMTKY